MEIVTAILNVFIQDDYYERLNTFEIDVLRMVLFS